jgi:hypothetical protein
MKTLILLFALAFSSAALASDEPAYGMKPSKKLEFEDGMVEGLNKRPLDSLNQLSEADRNVKLPHLYKKRTGFADETAETLKQVRYSQ